jgi:hypothetical protein
MRVDHRRLHVGVPQQRLHGADVLPRLQQVRGKTVQEKATGTGLKGLSPSVDSSDSPIDVPSSSAWHPTAPKTSKAVSHIIRRFVYPTVIGGACRTPASAGFRFQCSGFRKTQHRVVLPDTRNLTPEHSACKTGFCKRLIGYPQTISPQLPDGLPL